MNSRPNGSNGKLIGWILSGLVALAFATTGGYLAGMSQRLSQHESVASVHAAILAARGERIAALETRSLAQEVTLNKIDTALFEINRKIDAMRGGR